MTQLSVGQEEGTTLIELEDGSKDEVVATQLEVEAELDLNSLDYVDPKDDDISLEDLVEDTSAGDGADEDPV